MFLFIRNISFICFQCCPQRYELIPVPPSDVKVFLLIVWWARFLLLNLHRDEEDKEETQ
jgi:hypothetical protein